MIMSTIISKLLTSYLLHTTVTVFAQPPDPPFNGIVFPIDTSNLPLDQKVADTSASVWSDSSVAKLKLSLGHPLNPLTKSDSARGGQPSAGTNGGICADNILATATFSDQQETTGWSVLKVKTARHNGVIHLDPWRGTAPTAKARPGSSPAEHARLLKKSVTQLVHTSSNIFSTEERVFAAGFVEGILSASRISQFYSNLIRVIEKNTEGPQGHGQAGGKIANLKNRINRIIGHLNNKIGGPNGSGGIWESSPYWRQVRYIITQLLGIVNGFNTIANARGVRTLGLADFMLMNLNADLGELLEVEKPLATTKRGGGAALLDVSGKHTQSQSQKEKKSESMSIQNQNLSNLKLNNVVDDIVSRDIKKLLKSRKLEDGNGIDGNKNIQHRWFSLLKMKRDLKMSTNWNPMSHLSSNSKLYDYDEQHMNRKLKDPQHDFAPDAKLDVSKYDSNFDSDSESSDTENLFVKTNNFMKKKLASIGLKEDDTDEMMENRFSKLINGDSKDSSGKSTESDGNSNSILKKGQKAMAAFLQKEGPEYYYTDSNGPDSDDNNMDPNSNIVSDSEDFLNLPTTADQFHTPSPQELDHAETFWRNKIRKTGHCSALIRLTPANKDLLIGHTTWDDYSKMTRIFKYYDLDTYSASDASANEATDEENNSLEEQGAASTSEELQQLENESKHFKARKHSKTLIGMSSYPGMVSSGDEFYMLGRGLVVMDTSLEILNPNLYSKIPSPSSCLPTFLRAMVSNRLAETAAHWATTFALENCGIGSSQWLVTDYNQFIPEKSISQGTVYLVESIPGLVSLEDKSKTLGSKGSSIASYNRPIMSLIRQRTGHSSAWKQYGDLFSETNSPRGQLFTEAVNSVDSLSDMRILMRRNNYPHEVYKGPQAPKWTLDPGHAISARNDLNPTPPLAIPNGGIDAKVTSSCLFKSHHMGVQIISGPTHTNQPVFEWIRASDGSETFPTWPHVGLPDRYDFKWEQLDLSGVVRDGIEDEC